MFIEGRMKGSHELAAFFICGKQDGVQLESIDGILSLQQIIDIDWLLENIEGKIPEYEALSEEGKETVKNAGAAKAETRGE